MMALGIGLFAVHLPDAAELPGAWLLVGWLLCGLLLVRAGYRVPDDVVPRLGVLTSAVFVGSLIHLPVASGSVHLLLNGITGLLLGWRAPLAITVAVAMQAFLFGHGGFSTIGINSCVLGVPAVFGWLLWRSGWKSSKWAAVVCGVVVVVTVALNAGVVYFGLTNARAAIAGTLLVMHIPVLVVEVVAAAVVVEYILKVKPEWLVTGSTHSDGVTSSNGTSH
jgi:cobalt/nickel transport system permease protein